MKRQTGHPNVEALANFRAGLVGGISGRRITAHIARCERCAQLSDQLSTVTSVLASVPAPALPDAVERRIDTAIATEATARRVASLAGPMADPSAVDAPAPVSPAPVGPRLRLSPVQMLASVAACLLLAGLGYLLTVPGASGVPSSAGSALGRSASASRNGAIGRLPRRDTIGPAAGRNSVPFLVTVNTTPYQKSTLQAQVSSQLARQPLAPVIAGTSGSQSGSPPGNQEGTGGGASQPHTAFAPSGQLVGCVMQLTGGVPPALVQRATYQAQPAYVIAIRNQAWVVHLSCTAAKPALITSVALPPAG